MKNLLIMLPKLFSNFSLLPSELFSQQLHQNQEEKQQFILYILFVRFYQNQQLNLNFLCYTLTTISMLPFNKGSIMYSLLLIFIFGTSSVSASNNTTIDYFCSSICAAQVSACYGPSENQCWACAQSLFLLEKNSSGVCQTKIQHKLSYHELKTTSMDLSGYSTTKPTPQICDIYTLSGQYVAGDYISKTFSNLPLNHYQIIVRFGIGYIGTWAQSDQMHVQIEGKTYSWSYGTCPYSQSLCSSSLSDCFKIREFNVSHNSPTVSLKFFSSINQTNPAIKYWGIKDLTIAVRTCHRNCQTCFGPAQSNCITCSEGFFLLGNLCLPTCQYFSFKEKRLCLQQCPYGYFGSEKKNCQACQKYCLVCNNAETCQVWSDEKEGLIWQQNKPFWIFLIVIGFLIFLYLVWKLIIQRKLRSKISDTDTLKKSILSDDTPPPNQNESIEPKSNNEFSNNTSSNNTSTNINLKENRNEKAEQKIMEDLKSFDNVFDEPKKGHYLPSKKKRKVKPMVVEQNSNNSMPSTIQLDGTFENLKL